MSKFGEKLLVALNRLLPPSSNNQGLLLAKQSALTYLEFFQNRASSSFATFDNINLTGQTVLDVGCGLGANLVQLCEMGASRITALDIDWKQIQCTQSMFSEHYPESYSQIDFVTSDATKLPYVDNYFDAIISADTFEHIENLSEALQECSRVIKPEGYLYAYFPPFYAPWGGHMINWIRLPWCQVFFSEKTVINAARQIEKEGLATNNHLPPETRLDLQTGNIIPFVNHLTIKEFRNILIDVPTFNVVKVKLLAPGWRTKQWFSKLLQPLTQIPLLREMFTAKVVVILQKQG